MHRIVPAALAAAALVTVLVALQFQPGPSSVSALTNCSASGSGGNGTLLGLFNGARADAGLAGLSSSATLNNAAQWMAEDVARMIAGNPPVRHEPDTLGRSFGQRMA